MKSSPSKFKWFHMTCIYARRSICSCIFQLKEWDWDESELIFVLWPCISRWINQDRSRCYILPVKPPPPVSGDSPKWLENPESTTSIQNLPYLTKLLHQRLQIIMCFPHLQLNCLSLCMLTSMSTFTERFLCDFGIKSWFSSIAAWKLFGMLWVFIWLNCTTKHRCMSHWGTMQIFVKIFELFILTDCCTHVYIDAHDCTFTVYCAWLYINSVLYVNFLFDL